MRRPRVKSPLSDISRQGIAGHGNSITLSGIISGEPLEISNSGLCEQPLAKAKGFLTQI